MSTRKTVLLTGGAGAIGAHVIAHLMHNTDWDVVILDSFRHKGYRDRLKRICRGHATWPLRITTYQHDLTCPISPQLQQKIGLVDYILHLAALSDVFFSVENPVHTVKNNIDSTLTMLEYARAVKPEVFLYFSTDEVYGPVAKGAAHKEWSSHRPSNAYAASKAASEDLALCWWRSYGVPLIITNTMNNFSETQSPSKFPAMVQKRVNAGETVTIHGNEQEIGTRFYLHSRNAADAVLYILRNLSPHLHAMGELDEPDRYHIVGERAVSNLELAQTIGTMMGKAMKFEMVDFHKENPAHDIHYGLQDNKLRAAGWKQPKTFEESLLATIKWQQRNPEWLE